MLALPLVASGGGIDTFYLPALACILHQQLWHSPWTKIDAGGKSFSLTQFVTQDVWQEIMSRDQEGLQAIRIIFQM